MSVFKNFRNLFVEQIYIERAIFAAAQENYCKTLEFIEKYKSMKQLPPKYKVLEGMAFYKVGKIDKALKSFKCAFDNIKNDKDLSHNDQMYIAAYIVYYLWYIDKNEDVDIELFKEGLVDYNYNLDKVNSRIKKIYKFP